MSAINFPNNPELNEEFTQGEKVYRWNGFRWRAIPASLINVKQQVAEINLNINALGTNVLEKDNTTSFTPTENFHPATKKYVDDTVGSLALGDVNIIEVIEAEGVALNVTSKTVNVTRSSLGAAATSHSHVISDVSNLQTTLDGKATTVTYTATIGTSWSGTAPATQTVTVTGITSTDNPIVDVVMSGTFANDVELQTEFGKIYRAVTGTNSIIFSADGVPAVSIPIQIKVVK